LGGQFFVAPGRPFLKVAGHAAGNFSSQILYDHQGGINKLVVEGLAPPARCIAPPCAATAPATRHWQAFSAGAPARGIVNRIMREIGPINSTVPDFPLAGFRNPALALARSKKARLPHRLPGGPAPAPGPSFQKCCGWDAFWGPTKNVLSGLHGCTWLAPLVMLWPLLVFRTPVVAIVVGAWESYPAVLLAGFAVYVALLRGATAEPKSVSVSPADGVVLSFGSNLGLVLLIAGALRLRGAGEHCVARTRGERAVESAVCYRARPEGQVASRGPVLTTSVVRRNRLGWRARGAQRLQPAIAGAREPAAGASYLIILRGAPAGVERAKLARAFVVFSPACRCPSVALESLHTPPGYRA
jgi:hypothetical protein